MSSPKTNSNADIAQIYTEHRSKLRNFIAQRVSFKEDVEDILHNVFYNLCKIDLAANPIEQISAWLYAAARNQIIDRDRKKKEERLPELIDDDGDFFADISTLLADEGNDPETALLQSMIWEELETALAELPAEQRTVFELTELQGFSFKEIAESTGITVNTLISRKRYAVLHLRERLRKFV